MKKELKRYILAEYLGYTQRICNSKEEYEELIKKVNKYNNNAKNSRICGNISYVIDNIGRYNVIINEYSKLTPKMGITDLDNLTLKYNNSKELNKDYSSVLYNNKGSYVSIIYLEDKNIKEKTSNDVDRRIKSIDVLYKEDEKYFNFDYLKLCIRYYINNNDYGFFLDMANSFESNKCNEESIEELRVYINKYRNMNEKLNSDVLRIVEKLYKSHILERNKDGIVLRDEEGKELISRRRKRDFSFFVRNYGKVNKPKFMKYDKNTIIEVEDLEEKIQDSIEEEQALDAWDMGLTYRRK